MRGQIGSKRHEAGSAAHGFTIVELLIVVVVIAILAAITIVSYNGITAKANDATVQHDLQAFATQYTLLKDQSGSGTFKSPQTFTVDDNFHFAKSSYNSKRNNIYICVNIAGDRLAVSAQSTSGAIFQWVDGTITRYTPEVFDAGNTCNLLGDPYDAMRQTSAIYLDLPSTDKWRPWVR